MKKSHNKPFLTFSEQMQLLENRGLNITDETQTINDLSTIGYYRLKTYFYPFREFKNGVRIDKFKPNISWQNVIDLYNFDRKLRLLVLEATEWIEVSLRAKIAYLISNKYDELGYLYKNNFHQKFEHKYWLEHIKDKHKKEEHPHIFELIDTISFGSLSKLYSGLKNEDKKEIAEYFAVPYKKMQEWIRTLVYIRNTCAHHSILWNITLRVAPEKLNDIDIPNNKIYIVLMALSKLLTVLNKQSEWESKIYKLINEITKDNPHKEEIFKMLGMVE
jgi:abortive infection bacteriophage resistance protein